MTQIFVSKVDSNQLLNQVMLIQLNSRSNINPRPAGPLDFPPPAGGGGAFERPPPP